MKRIILFAVLLIGAITLHGQTIMNIHQSNGTILQIPLNTIDSITFTLPNPGNLATLSTSPIENISSLTATSGGNITNDGGTPITQRGVVWSTSPNPTTANSSTNNGGGTGSFTSSLTGLTANTTYYVRAYAINIAGTSYGNQLMFTTTGDAVSITALDCNSATSSGLLTRGIIANGVSSIVPYNGGNGDNYSAQTISSTGVTGLTANLPAGSFAIGNGTLTFTISGKPNGSGIASFVINIGGQSCTLIRTVVKLSSPGAGVTFNGYTYSSIIFGNGIEWMAENLRTESYSNGDIIPNIKDPNQWEGLATGAWANYMNNSQYDNLYGKLYNWYTVADPRNVCPSGWHVPTDAEWTVLTDYLGGGLSEAGGKMKSGGTQYWQSPNTGATNESGFSGLPGGYCTADGFFHDLGRLGLWWSATEYDAGNAFFRSLGHTNRIVNRDRFDKNPGFSVRCVRN
jgi:uncharacterized protein (TIGR02145 family)